MRHATASDSLKFNVACQAEALEALCASLRQAQADNARVVMKPHRAVRCKSSRHHTTLAAVGFALPSLAGIEFAFL